jgi:Zn-dependent peptidase ImmA (M78 family)
VDKIDKGEGEELGNCDTDRKIILINQNQPLQCLQDTLWHELKHALKESIKLGTKHIKDDDDREEFEVRIETPRELAFFQDNEEIMKWLMKKEN